MHGDRVDAGPQDDLLPPGTPIDLDNCAREPIHVPGSVQPRGVLFVVEEPSLDVRNVTANVVDVLGVPIEDVLGRSLADVLGAVPDDQIRRAIASFTDLRERNPLEVVVDVRGEPAQFDVILHREPDNVILVELELAFGPRPFSFPNTYLAVRGAVAELNRAAELDELFEITARSVRDLTGFDRVMVYRYDHEYNGEVVAEAQRGDLNSFLGLHYPASDIPAQARALYEKNWIRLISDVDYVPSPLVPELDPVTGRSIDLTHATLRSVSPIHVEYLKNMGVHASMSISLLRDGALWGLIACHHYAGTHTPPYGTRAAAEFLGSALSLRLVARSQEDELREQVRAQTVLGKLGASMLDARQSITAALTGGPGLGDLVPSDGVAVSVQGELRTEGLVPDPAALAAVVRWAVDTGDDVAVTESLTDACPDARVSPDVASGALVVPLPDGQYLAWFRVQEVRTVDWGGDPTNKALAVREGDDVRISPRKSFERWSETVRGRSQRWTGTDRDSARQLRTRAVDSLYERVRDELQLAERLQRSLLPEVTDIAGWQITARYEPAAGGRIGGDWYDAFEVPGGRFAAVLGDVAGHGVEAAGTMAQLRNVVRAHLFEGRSPAEALHRTNGFASALIGRAFATVVAATVDVATGEVAICTAGHLAPVLVTPGGAVRPDLRTSPPLGVFDATYRDNALTLTAGESLVMFSDGLVERRNQDIDVGIHRLEAVLRATRPVAADAIWAAMDDSSTGDDATILTLRRPS